MMVMMKQQLYIPPFLEGVSVPCHISRGSVAKPVRELWLSWPGGTLKI